MASDEDTVNLLESLRRLYSRIMALHAESRARSSINPNNTVMSRDIASPLSQVIDKLATSNTSASPEPIEPPGSGSEETSYTRVAISRDPDSWTELGELSIHLKHSHQYSGPSMDMGERLMQSTWEHLHTSIRLARQGNAKSARLHAELTSNALNEAMHYLSESVYSKFSEEVMKALEEISNQI
ncbi:hypothetical protein [Kaarinaea lacus]